MIVSDIACKDIGGAPELSAAVRADTARKGVFRAWFRLPAGVAPPPVWGDPFLAAFLIPCMNAHEDLRIEAPVSRRLQESVPQIQELIRGWNPTFGRVAVSCAETRVSASFASDRGAGAFFSGGVDSWHTLLKRQDEISHMILIRGFDIKADEKDLWAQIARSAADTAKQFSKTLVQIQTNIKKAGDPRWASWGRPFPGRFWRYCYQGSALAAVALCLQKDLGRIFIPSSYPFKRLIPFGSHPDLDPLWSAEDMSIAHDGCEAGRFDKIRERVAASPLALASLRVCLQNRPGEYNCCLCEKCLRTMIILRICGALDRAATFRRPLDLGTVRRMRVMPDRKAVYRELMERAAEAGDRALAQAIASALGERFSVEHLWGAARHRVLSNAVRWAPRRVARRIEDRFSHILD